MRTERVSFDLSTRACSLLQTIIECTLGTHEDEPESVRIELVNLANELNARLQRRDQDPQATPPDADWMNA